MLNRRQFLGSAAATTGLLAMPSIACAKGAVLMMAHAANEIHPAHIAVTSFKAVLDELVPGAFNVQIFPNRQLGDDKQCIESAMAGTLQGTSASGALFPIVTGVNAMQAWQLPFLVKDYAHFTKLAHGESAAKIHAQMKEAGLVGLATFDGGQRHFASGKKAVLKLDDFAGLKTRIVPIPLHKEIWETLGSAPVGLPYGEVYAALETGVIDAVEINVSSMLAENYWEVAKNFTLTGHYPWTMSTVLNQGFFEAQTPELQAALIEAGKRSVDVTMAYTAQQDSEGVEFLKSKGVQVHEVSDMAALRERVAPMVDKWAQSDALIGEFVAEAKATA